ncbi:MAG: four helix bundle protein [Patescibacteria group bacterium]
MNKKYDLEERTSVFSEEVINFVKNISKNIVTIPIISQLIRSATSIGANYCEADEAQSKKDLIHKISITKKETKETRYWLRIIETAAPEIKDKVNKLRQEAKELNLIFNAIVRSAKSPS